MSGNEDYYDYYNLFMKQFIETLAQLSAVLVTSTLAVPAYTYYSKRNLVKNGNNQPYNQPYNQQYNQTYNNKLSTFANETDSESDIEVNDSNDSTSSLLDDIKSQ
jgi:hypothetical protein